MKQPIFKYKEKEYKVVSMVWDKNGVLDPTIIYADENNENQSINNKKGEILNV